MNFRIWYLLSLIFLFYSLYLLWDEKYEVSYKLLYLETTKTNDKLSIFTCFSIIEFLDHERELLKIEPETKVIVSEYIEKSFQLLNRTYYENLKDQNSFDSEVFKELPLNRKNGFIFINHICFFTDQKLFSNLKFLKKLTPKLFASSNKLNKLFPQFAYLFRNTSNFSEIKLNLIVIENLGEPYSNCVHEWNINSEKALTKFSCLNICLKSKNRNSLYLYTGDDHNYLNINLEISDSIAIQDCLKKCDKESCILEFILSVEDEEFGVFNAKLDAYPSTSDLDYYLQFFGLIGLFINISVNEILFYSIRSILKLICLKIKKISNQLYLRLSVFIKISVLLICLIFSIIISIQMIHNYQTNRRQPIKSALSDFTNDQRPFSIILCIPYQFIKFGSMRIENETIFNNLTFQEIEDTSNLAFEKLIDKIYTIYGSEERSIQIDYSKKVYFRRSEYGKYRNESFLSRCFRIEIEKKEMIYQSLLSIGTLVIKLKDEDYRNYLNIFIVSPEKEFNLDTKMFEKKFKIMQTNEYYRETSTETNCYNYLTSKFKCFSRSSCLSLCINHKFLDLHQSLPMNTLIDKEFFNQNIANFKFINFNDQEINEQCKNENQRIDCNQTSFSASYKTQITHKDRFEINLSFETVRTTEQDSPISKLILGLINVCSIFFGMNLMKGFLILTKFINSIFKTNLQKYFKKSSIVFCSIGFLIHTFLIFDDIIRGDLIESGYFGMDNSTILPDLTFCFEFDTTKIDPAHKLTGTYLNRLTENITFEKVFEKISYINESKELIYLSPTELRTDYFDTHSFFYNNMKCLVINPKISFVEESFYFERFLYPFKVYLTKEAKQNELYFLGKKKNSREMNEIHKFKFYENANQTYKYLVNIVPIEISVIDIFKYFKNPISLFFKEQELKETTNYLENLENTTKSEYGFITKTFPIRDSNSEINDKLFEQYYLQIQQPILKSPFYPVDPNFKKQIFFTYVQTSIVYNSDTEPEIEFAPSCSVQLTKYRNADSYASMLQNILNVASLWLNVCILELYVYFNKIPNIFVLIHRKLNLLKNKIDVFI